MELALAEKILKNYFQTTEFIKKMRNKYLQEKNKQ
jgi:hypothetical protein